MDTSTIARVSATIEAPASRGKPNVPENYHTVVVELAEQGERTLVTLSQDNNPTEEAREHSEKNWQTMLDGLKKLLEA